MQPCYRLNIQSSLKNTVITTNLNNALIYDKMYASYTIAIIYSIIHSHTCSILASRSSCDGSANKFEDSLRMRFSAT